MTEAGIRTIDAFSFLVDEVGSVENIRFTRRDAYNFIKKIKEQRLNVDGIGRIDYDCFDDVVIFYTSYRLNNYNLVCAPFIGVNNHLKNILLGVAFLSEETIESFMWVFTTLCE
ncbi:Protein FAR1-RELATED SEQUENCE 5 [Dendrobium catenatum]|uniref:Protein FAR1-RELATED SEQUENCE 5 n=1 Tax=Dendrobium catenatum TaxID=906689 RepID=A0A2I0WEC4_9ASPA|nr:Protein FAR1-RELATED SEQUENCE 5 [Dendrobium catenatum]